MTKSSRSIGITFEKQVDTQLQKLGFQTCTPRKTAQLINKARIKGAFCIHKDFFSTKKTSGLDGLAIRPDMGMIGWQCKKDYKTWMPGKKRKLLTDLHALQQKAMIPVYVVYAAMGLVWMLRVSEEVGTATPISITFDNNVV